MKIDILSPAVPSIPIAHSNVNVWLIRDPQIRDPEVLSGYKNVLNSQEREKQQRFYFEKHRHQYLVTRGVLRHLLSLYEPSVSPSQWRFYENSYGRPYIENATQGGKLFFNVSHTENMIAIAISRIDKLGVDIEWILRDGKTIEIAESFFSPLEVRDLMNLPLSHQKERFFALWTLKEAYIKACGKGLSIPLDKFSYSFKDRELSIGFSAGYSDNPVDWLLWHMLPSQEHRLSLAMGERSRFNDGIDIDFFELDSGRYKKNSSPSRVMTSGF